MSADRVPQRGEVWAFRPLWTSIGRGQVVILDEPNQTGAVPYRLRSREGTGDVLVAPLAVFVARYDYVAASIDEAPAQRAAVPMEFPIRPGTAVPDPGVVA